MRWPATFYLHILSTYHSKGKKAWTFPEEKLPGARITIMFSLCFTIYTVFSHSLTLVFAVNPETITSMRVKNHLCPPGVPSCPHLGQSLLAPPVWWVRTHEPDMEPLLPPSRWLSWAPHPDTVPSKREKQMKWQLGSPLFWFRALAHTSLNFLG